MSNIHQNDELLRVQDENYDIVFNYDKHENGGVAVHAEKDGKNHKVNPEYARAALVKQIGSGGGWPADLPKPSVGGYGYTEQGNQTVITWDGDTEGKLPVVGADFTGCKVSEVPQNYTPSVSFNKIVFNGIEYNDISSEDFSARYGAIAYYSLSGQCAVYVCVDAEKGSAIRLTETGVYFQKTEDGYVSAVSYGTSDTVHKIDEKYLPASGGAIFVTTEAIDDSRYISSMSSDEICEAVMSGNTVYLQVSESVIALNNIRVAGNMDSSVDFATIESNETLLTAIVYHIEGDIVDRVPFFIGV